jgi:hypothetical protein
VILPTAWKLYAAGGAVAFMLASTGLAVHAIRQRAAAEAVARVYERQADSIRAVLAADSAADEAHERELQRTMVLFDSARVEALERAQRAEAARPTVVTRIVRQAPDTALARAVADSVVAYYETEVIPPLRSAVASGESLLAASDERVAVRDRTIAGQRSLIAALEARGSVRTEPGWLASTAGRIMIAVGAFGVGYLAGAAGG